MRSSSAKASRVSFTVNKASLIYVAGHAGLAGSAIVRRLMALGFENLTTKTSRELDLRQQSAVERYFETTRPECVILAAARVGGIHANNSKPADFIRDNLLIQTNVIDSAQRSGVRKFIFLGSSCIYPRLAPQPMKEEYLLTGALEPTNEWYAVAKIAGLKMCQALRRQHGFDAISVLPTNLYGPNDNFSKSDSHVLPAMIRKFHDAKVAGEAEVLLWGSGKPRREFLHADDFADAVCFLMQTYSDEAPINIGWGEDVSIAELAATIRRIVGFKGRVSYDASMPDGVPRKLLDISRLRALGWSPKLSLDAGIAATYSWFLENQERART
jgi:GDP-L-fucose synthase